MTTNLKGPTSGSLMLHGIGQMEADANPDNSGAFGINLRDHDGRETFDLTIFTHDAALSVELAAAINGILAKHGRLYLSGARVAA